jgi:hypothetical protein
MEDMKGLICFQGVPLRTGKVPHIKDLIIIYRAPPGHSPCLWLMPKATTSRFLFCKARQYQSKFRKSHQYQRINYYCD